MSEHSQAASDDSDVSNMRLLSNFECHFTPETSNGVAMQIYK